MINHITSNSPHIQVSPVIKPYINKAYNSSAYMTGDMRYDLESQSIKVFDGQHWQTLEGSNITVDLDYETKYLLDWVKRKHREEQELAKLAQEHPTIKDLVDDIKTKYEQIKMIEALIQPNNDKMNSSMAQYGTY